MNDKRKENKIKFHIVNKKQNTVGEITGITGNNNKEDAAEDQNKFSKFEISFVRNAVLQIQDTIA